MPVNKNNLYVQKFVNNIYRWDTAGQERFKCIAASYYRGANGKYIFLQVLFIYFILYI